MKANFYLESQQFCYSFEKYKIEEINEKKYVIPEKNAKRLASLMDETVEEAMIDLLNIGKKIYYNESIEDEEILRYVKNYGLFGFMSDFPINRYYFLDSEVILRDYNFVVFHDYISRIKLQDYMKIFLPRLSENEINNLINKCNDTISPRGMEKYITPELNKFLIFSSDYAEPLEMILQYAKVLYENLLNVINGKYLTGSSQILRLNNITDSLNKIPLGMIIKFNYLKQAIDIEFLTNLSQDAMFLKICKFCNRAFVAKNSKAEYDTYNCKNKANVYKFRSREAEN
jgi:hypothetical protein